MPWWENDFLSVRNNRVCLAGVDASALAEKHGTPIYVYGRDAIIARFRASRDSWANIRPWSPGSAMP